MSKMIDADAVMEILYLDPGIADFQLEMIKKLPTEELVRCKDCCEYDEWLGEHICVRLGSYHGETKPDDYCSYGRKKK